MRQLKITFFYKMQKIHKTKSAVINRKVGTYKKWKQTTLLNFAESVSMVGIYRDIFISKLQFYKDRIKNDQSKTRSNLISQEQDQKWKQTTLLNFVDIIDPEDTLL